MTFFEGIFFFFVDIWESVSNFFGFIYFYITNFFDYIDDGVRLILRYSTYFIFWISGEALKVAFEISQEFLESFKYSEKVESAWSAIPPVPRQILGFFRVPECVNILISAVGTKFTLKFVPFGK